MTTLTDSIALRLSKQVPISHLPARIDLINFLLYSASACCTLSMSHGMVIAPIDTLEETRVSRINLTINVFFCSSASILQRHLNHLLLEYLLVYYFCCDSCTMCTAYSKCTKATTKLRWNGD